LAVRLIYGKATTSRSDKMPRLAAQIFGAGPDRSSVVPPPPALIDAPEVRLLESAVRPLLEGSGPGADAAASPFGQALIQLIRLLGDMHRDHLRLVREELEQIRRINIEMDASRPAPARLDLGTGTRAAPADGTAEHGDPAPVPPRSRSLHPEAIQSLLGERLVAWEQERQSRWQRVIELLVKR